MPDILTIGHFSAPQRVAAIEGKEGTLPVYYVKAVLRPDQLELIAKAVADELVRRLNG